MAMTIRSTTGDPSNVYLDEETTIDSIAGTLEIEGTYINSGVSYPISGTYTIPTPDTVNPTYFCLQVSSIGVLNFQTSTVSMPTLIDPLGLPLYSDTVPANATSDQAFTSEAEPVLD